MKYGISYLARGAALPGGVEVALLFGVLAVCCLVAAYFFKRKR
ncbi:hypothetical protein [Streptomyces sp. NPDC050546]